MTGPTATPRGAATLRLVEGLIAQEKARSRRLFEGSASALPFWTLAELVEHARARPGALNWFASPGAPYLAFRVFLRDAGFDMAFVPYRGMPTALL